MSYSFVAQMGRESLAQCVLSYKDHQAHFDPHYLETFDFDGENFFIQFKNISIQKA